MSQVTLYSAYSDNQLTPAAAHKARLCIAGAAIGTILAMAGIGLWVYAMSHLNLSDWTFTILICGLLYLGIPGVGLFALSMSTLSASTSVEEQVKNLSTPKAAEEETPVSVNHNSDSCLSRAISRIFSHKFEQFTPENDL